MDLATLGIRIDSSSVRPAIDSLDGLKKKGAEVEKATASMESSFTKAVGVMKQLAVLAGVSFGVQQIANYTKEAILLAARVETLGVVLKVVGENAGYSSSQMIAAVESVKKMGITSQSATDAVIKIAQAQISVADSSKLARIAQDAAVIGNINSSEAFTRMINGIRSGEVEILKTIGLNVNFEQGYVEMARSLGKARDALNEQEKAQARANVVMEAGTRIAGSYEAALGTAGKMMNSMARYTEELKLGLGSLFGGVLTEGVSGVTSLLKNMSTYLEDIRKNGALQEMADTVSGVLKMGWLTVRDIVIVVWEAIKPLGPVIASVLPILGLIATGYGYIFAALKPVGTIIGEIIASTFNLGKMVGSLFGMLASAMAGQFDMVGVYRDQFVAAYEKISASGANVINQVVNGVETSVTAHQREVDAALAGSEKKSGAMLAYEALKSRARADENKEILAASAIREAAEKAAVEAAKKAAVELKKLKEQDRKGLLAGIQAQMDANDEYYTKLAEQTAKSLADADKIAEEKKKIAGSEYAYLFAQIDDWQDVEIEAGKETVKAAKKAADEKEKLAERLPEMYRQVYGDMRGYAKGYYDYAEQAIADQASLFSKAGMDQTVIAAWVTGELKKEELKRLENSTSVIDGIRAAEIKLNDDRKSFASATSAVVLTAHTGLATALSSNFYDVLMKKDTDLGDAWKAMWEGIVKEAANQAAKMIADAAVSQALGWLNTGIGIAGNLISNYGGQALTWGASILGFAEGSMNIPKDQMAVVHKGEIIIPAKESEQIRAAVPGGDFANVTSYFGDTGGISQADLLAGWWKTVEATTVNAIGTKPLNLVQAKSYEMFGEQLSQISATWGGGDPGGIDPTDGKGAGFSLGPQATGMINDMMGGFGRSVAAQMGLGLALGGPVGMASAMAASTARGMLGIVGQVVAGLMGFGDLARAMDLDAYNQGFSGFSFGPDGPTADPSMGGFGGYSHGGLMGADPGGFGGQFSGGLMGGGGYDGGGYDGGGRSAGGDPGSGAGSEESDYSARNGLDYVPYDGMRVELHKGERVQTASEVNSLGNKMDKLTATVEKMSFYLNKNTQDTTKLLKKFDAIGMPTRLN